MALDALQRDIICIGIDILFSANGTKGIAQSAQPKDQGLIKQPAGIVGEISDDVLFSEMLSRGLLLFDPDGPSRLSCSAVASRVRIQKVGPAQHGGNGPGTG
jgi:hypothetical protein